MWDNIKPLIRDLIDVGIQSVYLSGGAEPTMMSKWEDVVNLFANAGVPIALITNGTLLKKEHKPTINKLSYLAISSHMEVNKDLPGWYPDTKIGLRKVVTGQFDVNDIYSDAMKAGYSYVIFIPAVNYEGGGTIAPIEISVDGLPNAHVVKYPTTSRSYCHSKELRFHAWINYDGLIYLCQPMIGNTKYSIGTLHLDSFRTIWNSTWHKNVIGQMVDCKNCR